MKKEWYKIDTDSEDANFMERIILFPCLCAIALMVIIGILALLK